MCIIIHCYAPVLRRIVYSFKDRCFFQYSPPGLTLRILHFFRILYVRFFFMILTSNTIVPPTAFNYRFILIFKGLEVISRFVSCEGFEGKNFSRLFEMSRFIKLQYVELYSFRGNRMAVSLIYWNCTKLSFCYFPKFIKLCSFTQVLRRV